MKPASGSAERSGLAPSRPLRQSAMRRIAAVIAGVVLAAGMAVGRDAHAALVATITVTTTADEYDIASPNASCSLREALQSSNDGVDRGGCTHTGFYGANTIVLGTATYTLSRAGLDDDANQSADLDITDNVTISGNGAGTRSSPAAATTRDASCTSLAESRT